MSELSITQDAKWAILTNQLCLLQSFGVGRHRLVEYFQVRLRSHPEFSSAK